MHWSPSSDNVAVAGYRIYRNGTQAGTGAGTTYSDTGLKPGTSYRYRAVAYDAAGNTSSASNEVSATTLPPPDTKRPGTPSRLRAAAVSSSEITLSWNKSTDNVGVAGYRIYRNGSQAATTVSLSYADSGLSPAVRYTYKVSAFDAAGNVSAMSAAAVATTWPAPSTRFGAGGHVKTTRNAYVRSEAAPSGKTLGLQRAKAAGTVSDGPEYYGRLWWWKIDFESGADGWVSENSLSAP